MIFLLWHVFIILEALTHWFLIDCIGLDPTPDKKFLTWSKVVVIGSRFAVFFGLWWTLGIHENIEFWCYFSGALFSHLLWFPLVLNKLRGKRLDYLGKGPVDLVLGVLPPLARWWFLLVLEVAAIYTYFNPDLL